MSFNKYIPFTLIKPIITLSVAFSALTGYLLFDGAFTAGWIPAYLGVLLIAAGSSALNEVQEADFDRVMHRTRNRPVASGKISIAEASIISAILSFSGAAILWHYSGVLPSLLSVITLVWYNAVYTPLKRITPWAIIPGAVVGALPPLIGYTAAGGDIIDSQALMLAFFFFAGQIPHFWLILLRHGTDYENAGFPSLISIFSPCQIQRLTSTWITATALTAIGMTQLGVINHGTISWLVIIFSVAVILYFFPTSEAFRQTRYGRSFMIMNIYFLSIMICTIAASLLR